MGGCRYLNMEYTAIAAVISLIVAIYAIVLWYLGTRWIVRSLSDAPAPATRLDIVIDDKRKSD